MFLPGFLSDVIALLVLFPPTRKLFLGFVGRRVETQAQRRRAFADDLRQQQEDQRGPQRPNVIEGEWERRDK